MSNSTAAGWPKALFLIFALTLIAAPAEARWKFWKRLKPQPPKQSALAAYLERARQMNPASAASAGSLWSAQGRLADLAADNKARSVHDLVVIRITEQTRADAQGSVQTERSFNASSGISGLFGQVGATSGLQTMFSPNSSQSLDGSGQTSTRSLLQTRLTGQVVEVLPNGNLVIEAFREVEMNNERQGVAVRGVIRPTDLLPDNSVLSTSMANLEIELKGKGVISEGTRPPHIVTRWLLRLLGF